jgi:hypothetical protein
LPCESAHSLGKSITRADWRGEIIIVKGGSKKVEPFLLLAETNILLNVPFCVGVPEIRPVVELIDRPGGKPVALHVIGVALSALN